MKKIFAILPANENVLIVARGEDGYPRNVVMYNDGMLQPKQVSSGFEYSPLHNGYIYAHRNTDSLYLSFFHGEHFNYLGSLAPGVRCDFVHDLDVVDVSHFIVVTFDIWEQRNSICFYHNTYRNRMFLKAKKKEDALLTPSFE